MFLRKLVVQYGIKLNLIRNHRFDSVSYILI